MLPAENPDRLAALPDLAAALVEMGEFGRAEAVLANVFFCSTSNRVTAPPESLADEVIE